MYPIEFFWRAAQRFPDRVAVVSPHGDLTFRDLARRVQGVAASISKYPMTGEGVVGVGAANSVDHLVAILAVLAAGRVWSPLNPRNGDPELKRLLAFVEPDLVLVDDDMARRLGGESFTIRLISELPDADGAIPMGPRATTAWSLDRTQALKFTGGTTGFPKGVQQPLRAWNTNIVTQINAFGLDPTDRYLVAAPLTHGTSTYMLPVLGGGGALIFPAASKPSQLLDAAVRHSATLLFAPPTLIMALAAEQAKSPRTWSSLRYLIYGGAPMRPEQIRQAQNVFGPVLCTTYGQTEAPQIITYLSPKDMLGGDLASVGRPSLFTQVGVFDGDGHAVATGNDGEIAVRGDLVMTGYFKAPEETARTLKNGWLFTGDAGALDDRGFLFIKDRIRDVIITGGFNVYPSDVETILSADPDIANCAVFGIADDKWGEAVHAAVELNPGAQFDEERLKALLKRELGSVKTPKSIHLFDSLPRSPVGKVSKPAIRDELLRRAADQETLHER